MILALFFFAVSYEALIYKVVIWEKDLRHQQFFDRLFVLESCETYLLAKS